MSRSNINNSSRQRRSARSLGAVRCVALLSSPKLYPSASLGDSALWRAVAHLCVDCLELMFVVIFASLKT